MTKTKQVRRSDLAYLDRAIIRRDPTLSESQVRAIRSKIIRYIGDGFAEGFDVALIKQVAEDEIRLRVLRHEKD